MVLSTSQEACRAAAHLSKVELGVLLGCHALNLEKGRVRSCVAFGPLVAKDAAFCVQSVGQKEWIVRDMFTTVVHT